MESNQQLIADVIEPLRGALVARYGWQYGVDAAAEAVLWAWENQGYLAGMKNPAGYLYRVGQSAARRSIRLERRSVELLPKEAIEQSPSLVDDELLAAVGRLPQKHRVAIVLVHMYGYTYQQAADMTGVSEAAITNHVHRGLLQLRRRLTSQESKFDAR